MRKKNLLFLLILWCLFMFGQKPLKKEEIDSIQQSLSSNFYGNKNYETACTELYFRSKEINYKKGQIQSLLLICQYYIAKKENYDQIFIKTKEVENLADKSDHQSLAFAKSYGATALIELGFLKQAKKKIRNSNNYGKSIINSKVRDLLDFNNFQNFAHYYKLERKKDSTLFYLNKALKTSLSLDTNPNLKYFEINLQLAEFFIDQKNPKKAKIHLASATKIKRNDFQNAYLFFIQAKIESTLGEYEISLASYEKASSLALKTNDASLQSSIYGDLADFYNRKKDLEKHIYYLKESTKIKDSLNIVHSIQIDKISVYDKEDGDDSIFSGNVKYIWIVSGFLIFACFLYWKKKKKSIDINLIKEKNIVDNNDEFLISISELIQLANENDDTFYIKFKEMFPDFEEKMLKTNSTLKPLDLEFCAYIKLNFTTKEIARIKNISIRAVEGRKYRIRKALKITQDDNMYTWISQL